MRHSCGWIRQSSAALQAHRASGYTSFLQDVALEHRDDAFADGAVPDAYAVMSNLLNGIVEQVIPPFRLSKLEGDAVFAYATEDSMPPGHAVRRSRGGTGT